MPKYLKLAPYGFTIIDNRQQTACDKRDVSPDEAAGIALDEQQKRSLRKRKVCRLS